MLLLFAAPDLFDDPVRLIVSEMFRDAAVAVGWRGLEGLLAFMAVGYPLLIGLSGRLPRAGPSRGGGAIRGGIAGWVARRLLSVVLAATFGFLAFREWLPALVTAVLAALPVLQAGRQLPAALVLSMRDLGATRRQIFWRVAVPWTLPALMRGLRLALTVLILICVVVGTRALVTGAGPYQLSHPPQAHHPARVLGAAELFVGLAVPLNLLLMRAGRALAWWETS